LAEIHDALRTGSLSQNLKETANFLTNSSSRYDVFTSRRFNGTMKESMWLGTSMDPAVKEKEKFIRLEKVQKNLVRREKEQKFRIDEIIKRSTTKEKAKDKILKNKVYTNVKSQEKRADRI